MQIAKTAKLNDKVNKGQRQVIVEVLSRLNAPIALEDLTKKVVATGKYNGKGTKGHVNSWAQAKAGGDLGSVRYHIRALAEEKRVTVAEGAAKPAPAAKKAAKKTLIADVAAAMPEPKAGDILPGEPAAA